MKQVKKYEHYYLEGADGKQHEVSEQQFRDYKRSVWREEAQYKRERSVIRDKSTHKSELDKIEHIKVASLESILAGGGEHHIGVTPDFSDELVDIMEQKALLKILGQAVEILDESEKEMYKRLFEDGISDREYERRYSTPRSTVGYQRKKIQNKIIDFCMSKK